METITVKIYNLIDKLKLAEEIYSKASSRIHNEPMRNQLSTLAERKKGYLKKIKDHLDLNKDEHILDLTDRLQLEIEKAGIELNHLVLNRNEKELLSYCIKREDELVDVYKDLLNEDAFDQSVKTILSDQLKETKDILDELRNTFEIYVEKTT